MIKFNEHKIKIICFVLIISFSLLLLLSLSIKNSEFRKLNKISKEIVNINSSLKNGITNNNFDSNKSYEIMEDNLEKFNSLSEQLNNFNFKKTSSKTHKENLLKYINLNINLHDSALKLLDNPSSDNFSSLYSNLISNEKAILTSSDNLSKSHLDISFPKYANSFFVMFNKYINNIYRSNREKDINSNQKSDFLIYLNSVISDFSTLKEDMQSAIVKIHEDNRDLSILIKDVDSKKLAFSELKNKSYSISIPYGGKDIYYSLEEMLNSYEVYIDSLRNSLKSEIFSNSHNDAKTSDNLEDVYSDTLDKYSNFISTFNSFEEAVYNYKNE